MFQFILLNRTTLEFIVYFLQKERTSAQVYLAHASEVLLQSMNQALHSNLKDILAEASFNMVQCFGQFDPVSAGQYLALHQV